MVFDPDIPEGSTEESSEEKDDPSWGSFEPFTYMDLANEVPPRGWFESNTTYRRLLAEYLRPAKKTRKRKVEYIADDDDTPVTKNPRTEPFTTDLANDETPPSGWFESNTTYDTLLAEYLAVPAIWFEAARTGNDQLVAELLAKRPDLLELHDQGRAKHTALHLAAIGGHEEVIAQLLAACPALIHVRNRSGKTALDVAAAKRFKTVVQMLGMEGVTRVNITSGLRAAVCGSHRKIIDLLLFNPAEYDLIINPSSQEAVETLHMFAERGEEPRFSQLLRICPKLIDGVNRSGSTVLHRAARHGQARLVDQILELRPEMISATDDLGGTALDSAVEGGHQSVAEQLLAIKPRLIFHKSLNNDTILHTAIASCEDDPQFVLKLWRMNPRALTHPNDDDLTPFDWALDCEKKQKETSREKLTETFQWSLSYDEIINTARSKYLDRAKLLSLMKQLCALPALNQDVEGIVFGYVDRKSVV